MLAINSADWRAATLDRVRELIRSAATDATSLRSGSVTNQSCAMPRVRSSASRFAGDV